MAYFSENMVARANERIANYSKKRTPTLLILQSLCLFLTDVMNRRGSILYVCKDDVDSAYEDVIFKHYRKLPILYGFSADDHDVTSEITHISIDSKWHAVKDDAVIEDDFRYAFAHANDMLYELDLSLVETEDDVPCDYIMSSHRWEPEEPYEEYCYVVNQSNWKYIAAMTYKCICAITSN